MKVIKIKEHKDGSATMTYTINKQEEQLFRDQAKKSNKRYSHAFINSVILKVLKKELRHHSKTANAG